MNETVLITGASSGIGLELAKCFAADGAKLILVARNASALEKIANELQKQFSIDVEIITADLTLPESPESIFENLKGRGINVDVLVNNAGFGLHGAFAKLPLKRQLEIIAVNNTALVALTGLFLPKMISQNHGGILNVGSVAGFVPGPNMAVYYASKAFVLSFSEALLVELRDTKIRVTNLCPGPTDTNFSKTARLHHSRTTKIKKMTATEVARIGYEDFRNGTHISLPGAFNKLAALAAKFLPRKIVRQIVGHYNQLKPSE